MNQINCVSEDFWERPFTIDFDDEKFGYCVLAVFNKKKEFQRTYMIPPTIRNRVFYSKRLDLSNFSLDDISSKVYNMCQEACPSFDSYKSVMHYYNKTEATWKNRKVYAVYVNFLNYFEHFKVNYQEQIIGDTDSLSDEELNEILADVIERYNTSKLQNYQTFIANLSYISMSRITESNISLQRNFFFTKEDNTPKHTLIRNFQMLYASCGINVPSYELPVLDLLQITRTYIGYRCAGVHVSEQCKGYATSLVMNDLILNAKCVYQCIFNRICLGYSSFSEAIKAMLAEYFCGHRAQIQFKDESYLINTLRASLKCFAVSEVRSKYFGCRAYAKYDMQFAYSFPYMYIDSFATCLNEPLTLDEAKTYVNAYTCQDKYNVCFQTIPYLCTNAYYATSRYGLYTGAFDGYSMPAYDKACIYHIKFGEREGDDRWRISEIIT